MTTPVRPLTEGSSKEALMRTIHSLTTRPLFLLLSSALAFTSISICVPRAIAGTAHGIPSAAAPTPFFGGSGFGQEISPGTQPISMRGPVAQSEISPPQLDIYSVTPETLGDLMMIHQRYLAAIEAYQRAPHDSAVIWNKLGIAYQHLYALDMAKLQYEKALSIDPKYAEALNNLGTVYYGQQNYGKAESFYQKALRLNPNCASFYSNLGTAYFADHNYKHGIAAYRKAFSIDPQVFISDSLQQVAEMGPIEEQASLNYALARLYAQAGMVDATIHYLRVAFLDGFNDTKKLLEDQSFAAVRKTTQFRLLLTEEHVVKAPDGTVAGATDQALVRR